MTLPHEELRSLQYAREFLVELATFQIKRVPKAVRVRARDILRHYPMRSRISMKWGV